MMLGSAFVSNCSLYCTLFQTSLISGKLPIYFDLDQRKLKKWELWRSNPYKMLKPTKKNWKEWKVEVLPIIRWALGFLCTILLQISFLIVILLQLISDKGLMEGRTFFRMFILGVFNGTAIYGTGIFLVYGNGIKDGFNTLLELESFLWMEERGGVYRTQGFLDKFIRFFLKFAITFSPGGLILAYLQVDPLLPLIHLIKTDPSSPWFLSIFIWILKVLRILILGLSGHEWARIPASFLLITLYSMSKFNSCGVGVKDKLKVFNGKVSRTPGIIGSLQFSNILKHYRRTTLVLKTYGFGLSNFFTVILSFIFSAGIFYIFISLRMHQGSPLPLLVIRPIFALITIVLANTFLLQAQTFRDNGDEVRKVLVELAGGLRIGRKYFKRVVTSLDKLRFNVAIGDVVLFPMGRGTKGTFYMTWFIHITNALLLVPNRFVFKK